MQITSAPPTICGTAATAVAFNASKSDSTFLCQLSNADAGATQSSMCLTPRWPALECESSHPARAPEEGMCRHFQVFPCLMHIRLMSPCRQRKCICSHASPLRIP